MAHPEYFYWFALAVFGVPAIVIARAVVPAMAMLIVAVNVLAWRAGMSWQGEGLMLTVLYAVMLAATMRLRLSGAEAYAAALWGPMIGPAVAQAAGWPPAITYWAIYWLAMAQVLSFGLVGHWPIQIARGLVARVRRQRGILACPA